MSNGYLHCNVTGEYDSYWELSWCRDECDGRNADDGWDVHGAELDGWGW